MIQKNRFPTLNFDMDGTLVNTYAVKNWLDLIKDESIELFENAIPMRKNSYKWIKKYIEAGGTVNIITKTPANATNEYAQRVVKAKIKWIEKYLNFEFDNIFIIDYYCHKNECSKGILFDDCEAERIDWGASGLAFEPKDITKTIKTLLNLN